jgi:hypothetical protein
MMDLYIDMDVRMMGIRQAISICCARQLRHTARSWHFAVSPVVSCIPHTPADLPQKPALNPDVASQLSAAWN